MFLDLPGTETRGFNGRTVNGVAYEFELNAGNNKNKKGCLGLRPKRYIFYRSRYTNFFVALPLTRYHAKKQKKKRKNQKQQHAKKRTMAIQTAQETGLTRFCSAYKTLFTSTDCNLTRNQLDRTQIDLRLHFL